MQKNDIPVYYSDYLKLDQLLSCQHPKSTEHGATAHDEMLFIIVHQVYELWFKQILHEMDSIIALFGKDYVDEKSVGVAVMRLNRVTEIQKLLVDQLGVMETMTPLDFLEFRDFLFPASGFQSVQFRLIENKMGMRPEQRLLYNKQAYYENVQPDDQNIIKRSEGGRSLLDVIEQWLERTPFLDFGAFNFWAHYRQAVHTMLQTDREIITSNSLTSAEEKAKQLHELAQNEENFAAVLDEGKHKEMAAKHQRSLSHKATQAALLIHLYRDEPILHIPFRLLTALTDMDEMFTTWRYRHAQMVHRMIGTKIGTGGSTGYNYLKATVEKYRVFGDLFNLSTFLIPRSSLPDLPPDVRKSLGFAYTH